MQSRPLGTPKRGYARRDRVAAPPAFGRAPLRRSGTNAARNDGETLVRTRLVKEAAVELLADQVWPEGTFGLS
jgi:hypothetical protein